LCKAVAAPGAAGRFFDTPMPHLLRPIVLYDGCMTHAVGEESRRPARAPHSRPEQAVERALGTEAGCGDVLQLLACVRGAVRGLMAGVMEDHVRFHVVERAKE
jgi:Metal-sensitive transcriptional repressor